MPEGGVPLLAPQTLLGGRYRLERRIATGGMASVWLARDEQLERPVAVKVLSDVLAEDPAYLARFRREARLAAGLSNPSLVRIFDYSGTAERPYLVMEYIEGGTLADRLAAGTVAELDAGRLAEQLLGALSHIHAAGVVHRDVKPSNVLIDVEGRARLTDFGIAQPEDATRITSTGEVIGTLKYMAPEVLEGQQAAERSDLYACGVLLGECLGTNPPPQLASLVEHLTAPDPAGRPASAEHALALLETGVAPTAPATTEPLLAAPPAPSSRVIEISGRRALALAAVLAVIAVAVVVAALGGGSSDRGSSAGRQQGKQATPPTTSAPETPTRSTMRQEPPAAKGEATKPPGEPTKRPPEGKKPPKGEKLPPGQAKKLKEE